MQFLNGLGRHWSTAKMIVQGDRKIQTLSLLRLYGELQAQESTVLKDCANLGGPLALMAQTPQVNTPQYSYMTTHRSHMRLMLKSMTEKNFRMLLPWLTTNSIGYHHHHFVKISSLPNHLLTAISIRRITTLDT